jgi:hypothetical protein
MIKALEKTSVKLICGRGGEVKLAKSWRKPTAATGIPNADTDVPMHNKTGS